MQGLLNKLHTSTKLPNVNLEVKRRKQDEKRKMLEELIHLKQLLREKIQETGVDIEQFFNKCDADKNGVFSYTEFEQAFVVLDIQVPRADLRRFIAMADANKDGKITLDEMQSYLTENVGRHAGMMGRKQEPQLVGDSGRVLVGR